MLLVNTFIVKKLFNQSTYKQRKKNSLTSLERDDRTASGTDNPELLTFETLHKEFLIE